MKTGAELAAILVGLVGGLLITLAYYWVVWMLWCLVLPQLYPLGPAAFIRPDYWLFVGCAVLLRIVSKTIFGNSRKS